MANILIVEDNESLRLAYSSFLSQENHTITTAASVDEALAWLAANTPDVILLDMLLPKKNGMELLQAYDVKQLHSSVKVIVFSNYSELTIQEEAIAHGASIYLTKSLATPKDLVETVAGVLKSQP